MLEVIGLAGLLGAMLASGFVAGLVFSGRQFGKSLRAEVDASRMRAADAVRLVDQMGRSGDGYR